MDEKLIDETIYLVKSELLKANKKFPPFNSTHEGYGVLIEEVDEMWDEIKNNNTAAANIECIQVAAMAIKFVVSMRSKKNKY